MSGWIKIILYLMRAVRNMINGTFLAYIIPKYIQLLTFVEVKHM